ncbi:MAG TPA: YceI family protein [Mucilaginibacter sp.]|jgi:polyisoprenoid-binding protein YceI|nr:YceI family protein [Mucilaginibacter sp.]
MKKLLILTAIISAILANVLTAQSLRSSITFEIKNLGITTTGTIGGLSTRINFNPANLASSTVEASVDANTINTDNSSRDEHLRSEDFFDVARYPKIFLRSVAFRHRNGNNYTGTFILTIRDKSKQIEIPFIFLDKGNSAEFKGTFKINRLDFGVGGTSMVLSDDVTITIDSDEKKTGLAGI